MNGRLASIIRKEFIQIRRDPRTLVLVLVIPVMQLFLLGYAATNDVRNVPLAVYDQDRSPASRRLLEAYRAADYFLLAFDAGAIFPKRNEKDVSLNAIAGLPFNPFGVAFLA